MDLINRRTFVAACGAGSLLATSRGAPAAPARPKVAALFTSFTPRAHAHVILENFLVPYLFNGEPTDPRVDVVSFHADQFQSGDMARDVARQFNIPIFPSIKEAMRLGGKDLAVDAVLSICEQGSYPQTELKQVKYPRKRFFDEYTAVIREAGRPIPVFNDKHLSYRWDWSKEMMDVTGDLKIPFLAGSSVPLAERRPAWELPKDAEIEEAVAIHGGGFESYDIHAAEVLQAIVEARRGGETGVSRIEYLEGDDLYAAARKGRWSPELADAALATEPDNPNPTVAGIDRKRTTPFGTLIEYRDGMRATILQLGGNGTRFSFGCRLKGDPTPHAFHHYVGPWQNRNLFKALSHAIQEHFVTGVAPYPVERTYLTTGIVEAACRAKFFGKPVITPHLEFAYAAKDFRAMREMGATWKIITDETPEPKGIERVKV